MTSPDNHVLCFRNVSARYPSASGVALTDCSFSMAQGEHVALLGVNGSGKTTLLLAIAGLVETDGAITVDGVALGPRSVHEVRNRIGMLFSTPEDQLLFPRVLDDVAYSLLRRGMAADEARKRARQELEMLGVGDLADREPYELSHGQRLRVALAGVLVVKPALLLLDEATAALDPPGRRALARLLKETPSAFLLATHDLEVAQRTCGRFLVLEHGRKVADTTVLDEARPLFDRDSVS
jgi:cobalt/nickel transport system ATP-binding protein